MASCAVPRQKRIIIVCRRCHIRDSADRSTGRGTIADVKSAWSSYQQVSGDFLRMLATRPSKALAVKIFKCLHGMPMLNR